MRHIIQNSNTFKVRLEVRLRFASHISWMFNEWYPLLSTNSCSCGVGHNTDLGTIHISYYVLLETGPTDKSHPSFNLEIAVTWECLGNCLWMARYTRCIDIDHEAWWHCTASPIILWNEMKYKIFEYHTWSLKMCRGSLDSLLARNTLSHLIPPPTKSNTCLLLCVLHWI